MQHAEEPCANASCPAATQAFWTLGALAGGGILFALFSLPFWVAGVGMARSALSSFVKCRVELGPESFRIDKQVALINPKTGEADWLEDKTRKFSGKTSAITGCSAVSKFLMNDVPQGICVLENAEEPVEFGEGLEMAELEWIASEVNDFLRRRQEDSGASLD